MAEIDRLLLDGEEYEFVDLTSSEQCNEVLSRLEGITSELEPLENDINEIYNLIDQGVAIVDSPTLFAPALTLDAYNKTLTIVDEANGLFPRGYQVFYGDDFVTEVRKGTVDLSVVNYTEERELRVRAFNSKFKSTEYGIALWKRPLLKPVELYISALTNVMTISDENTVPDITYTVYFDDREIITTSDKEIILTNYGNNDVNVEVKVKVNSPDDYYESSYSYATWVSLSQGSEGLAYTVLENGTIRVTGRGTCTDRDVIIPVTIEDKPVIQVQGFDYDTELDSLYIGGQIQRVSGSCCNYSSLKRLYLYSSYSGFRTYDRSFAYCDELSDVYVGRSPIYYAPYTFYDSGSTVNLRLKDLVAYCNSTPTKYITGAGRMGNPTFCFANCNIWLNDDIIAYGSWANGGERKDLILPEGVVNVMYGCFDDIILSNVTFPTTCKYIGQESFGSVDNLIFLGTGIEIDKYAFSRSNINALNLDGVKIVRYGAFENCTNLRDVVFSPSLELVESYAFHYDTALKTVIFKSTPSITVTSFSGCSALTDIYVPWAEGDVAGAPWGATNATIHYDTEAGE